MDFRLSDVAETFRQQAAEFIAQHFTPEMEQQILETGIHHNWDFHRALAAEGLLAPGWPEEFGGQGRSDLEMIAFNEEFQREGAPMMAQGTTIMVLNIILHCGSKELQELLIPPAMRGEFVIALGFTEPESGSDVAAAQTRAVRDGDEWVINGSKMFTTNATEAKYIIMLTRTNPTAAKHAGLTTFIVPLDDPGVEVQPVHTISGERTNITYYNDVRVPDVMRIGDVDKGWDVMNVGLTFERSGTWDGYVVRLQRALETWATTPDPVDGHLPIEDDVTLAKLGRLAAECEAVTLLGRRSAWVVDSGGMPGVEGSMTKLYGSEVILRQGQDFVNHLGADGVRLLNEPTAPAKGEAEFALRFALGATTYGGTSEIQRDIIARHGLGLPRGR